MSEEMLVQHCSPTLAGLKTANMFTCSFSSKSEMVENLRQFNRILCKKGVRVLPLRYNNTKALIYIYRPKKLMCDLEHDMACRILCERGYTLTTPESCVVQLINRLSENDEFPHEIGLFLGYPPEDVCGFIENRTECLKCTGCWRVYSDEDRAQKLFAKYKKCTNIYNSLFQKGSSLERLTVNS